jgi:hypothetical protein
MREPSKENRVRCPTGEALTIACSRAASTIFQSGTTTLRDRGRRRSRASSEGAAILPILPTVSAYSWACETPLRIDGNIDRLVPSRNSGLTTRWCDGSEPARGESAAPRFAQNEARCCLSRPHRGGRGTVADEWGSPVCGCWPDPACGRPRHAGAPVAATSDVVVLPRCR